MKSFKFLCVLVTLCGVSAVGFEDPSDYTEANFTTFLDHYGFGNETFQIRYFTRAEYWRFNPENPGPIFFYCGNEADITLFIQNSGFIPYLAQELEALVVFAEHRYFGKSLPFGRESFSGHDKVKYLSPHQALGDFAYLVKELKDFYYNAPVIVWGGSYGGMLAAWFRIKYPDLVDGAIAASAPIMHFQGTVNAEEFYKIVTNDFAMNSPECPAYIRTGYELLENYIKDSSKYTQLQQTFRTCEPINSEDIAEKIIEWLTNAYTYMAMTDYPYPTNFLTNMPAWPVSVACDQFQKLNENPTDWEILAAMRDAAGVYYNYTGDLTCNRVNQQYEDKLGDDGWDYLSCTTLAMPLGSDGIQDMFPSRPWSKQDWDTRCLKKWNVAPQYEYAYNFYGASKTPKNVLSQVSNIFFSNGGLDPWQSGSVLETVNESVLAIVMKDAAHHLDLRTPNPNDPESVVKGRQYEKNVILQWLSK